MLTHEAVLMSRERSSTSENIYADATVAFYGSFRSRDYEPQIVKEYVRWCYGEVLDQELKLLGVKGVLRHAKCLAVLAAYNVYDLAKKRLVSGEYLQQSD